MKLWQKITGAVAALTVFTCGALFAACGDGEDNDKNTGEDGTEVTISWQFTGAYNRTVDHGLYELSGEYEVLMNLTSDGNGAVNFYFIGNGGREDNSWYQNLTWTTETDRDGLTLLTIKDGINPSGDYEIYQETDGTFELGNYYMPLGKGSTYHREPNLVGTSTVTYTTVDAWKAAIKTKYENMEDETGGEEEKQAIVTFKTADEKDSVELYDDNTAKISAFEGKVKFDYTWAVDNGVITLTSKDKPDEKIVSTSEGGVVTLVYTGNLGGNDINLTFTCSDIGALIATPAIVTFETAEKDASVEFYADKTAKIIAFGGKVKFDYTWTISGDVISLQSVAAPDEAPIVSTSANGVTTLVYTATFAGNKVLTFTCNDISALKA